LVERQPSKLDVAGSSPVARFSRKSPLMRAFSSNAKTAVRGTATKSQEIVRTHRPMRSKLTGTALSRQPMRQSRCRSFICPRCGSQGIPGSRSAEAHDTVSALDISNPTNTLRPGGLRSSWQPAADWVPDERTVTPCRAALRQYEERPVRRDG